MLQVKLIVTGDDFGYCPRRNQGIVDCFLAGAVSNVSLLVNGSAAADAAKLARRYNIPIGLHAQPLRGLSCMRGAQDKLFSAQPRWILPWENGIQNSSIKRSLEYVREVRHVFAEVLEEYGIKYTRVPIEPGLHNCDWIAPSLMDFYLGVEEDSFNTVDVFTRHGIRWPDIYIGLSTMGKNMSVSNIWSAIDTAIVEVTSKAPSPTDQMAQSRTVTIELMVHPGYPSVPPVGGCGEGPDDFSQSWERLHELQTLIKPELQSHYKTRNIQLCSFKDL